MPTIYFTLPHNKPSGGVKVVNEFVNLCIEKGYKSFLCIAEENSEPAKFIDNPAPIISLDEMRTQCRKEDIIVCCWQSIMEYEAVKATDCENKFFWQHGILIPNDKMSVGERVYREGVFNKFCNVSEACASFIRGKYNLDNVSTINPFFDIDIREQIENEKSGYLVLARRGAELLPQIESFVSERGKSLTVLHPPFDNALFINLLKYHKFFINIDNGLKYNKGIKGLLLKNKWINHDVNYCGFPVPPIEAVLQGTIVIGFAMGGGLEWMTQSNCLLADDGDLASLLEQINISMSLDDLQCRDYRDNSFRECSKFTKENSWNQFKAIIGDI